MRKHALGLAAVVFMTTAACSAQEQPTPTESVQSSAAPVTGTPSPSPSAVPTGAPSTPPSQPTAKIRVVQSLAEAYPSKNITVTRSSSKVGVNRWLYPDTVDAEGRIIGSIEDERHVERSLVIYDPVGRRVVRTLATYPGGGNFLATIQASETVTDGRYVVWAEGSSNGEFLDWTLQIFDLKTGVKRLIARNGQFQDGSLLPKEISSLVIKGDRVWWTAGYGSTQKSLGVGVYSAALDGGGATLWRRDTAGLWPIKDGFLAAERVALPGKRDQGSHIVRLDTRGQRIGAILEERTTGFAGNDEFRIWGVPTPESAAEDAEPEEERIRIRTADGALAELPGTLVQESVQGRFAGWQGEGGAWFLDTGTGTAVSFRKGSSVARVVHGHLLWSTSKGGVDPLRTSTWNLVKLADLG